jgi:molecular chaperone IbpA
MGSRLGTLDKTTHHAFGVVFLTRLNKEKAMTINTFTPYFPSTVGFDRIFDALERVSTEKVSYPPHNIVKHAKEKNKYLVELAVAGFSQDEIEIDIVKGTLTITGKKDELSDKRYFLHRGIATRSFKKSFQVAETVQVNGAVLSDGILTVELENVIPEEELPKRIPIVAGKQQSKLLQE